VLKEVCVAATDEQALEIARPYLKGKYDAYVEWGQSDVLPPSDTLRREFAELTAGGRSCSDRHKPAHTTAATDTACDDPGPVVSYLPRK
jgi:hypothetical protein